MISCLYSSDQHINSDLGLLAPNIKLDSGRTISQTPYQEITWRYWLDFCAKLTTYPGDKIIVLHGDLFDLDTLGGQRISDNPADIMKMGKATFAPLLDIAAYRFVVRGTDKHGGKVNFLEEQFAEMIGTQRHPETNTSAWWHLRQNIEGVNTNVGHHITIGQKPWTEDNALFSKLYEIIINETKQDYPIPDLVIRGHVHTPKDTQSMNQFSRLIITPSWQGKNVHGYKVALDKPTFHGGTIVKFDNHNFEAKNFLYKPRKDSVWTI